MTNAAMAQRRADHAGLVVEYRQIVLRARRVRETSAMVREETQRVVEDAKARRQHRSSPLAGRL